MLFGGMIYRKKLSSFRFFNAVYWAGLDTETTKGAAPGINSIIRSIGDHSVFGTHQMTVVTTDANG